MYFPPSNVVFKMKRVIIHMKKMGKNYLICILSSETIVVGYCFQCPDDLGNFNPLFCSHSGNLAYIIVQKREIYR